MQAVGNEGTAVGIAVGIAMDVDSIHYFGSRTYHSVLVVEYILGSENDVKIDLHLWTFKMPKGGLHCAFRQKV